MIPQIPPKKESNILKNTPKIDETSHRQFLWLARRFKFLTPILRLLSLAWVAGPSLAVIAIILSCGSKAYAAGASVPFTEYEAEVGTLGGGATTVAQVGPPANKYATPAIEASGRAFVQLTGTGQSVTWTNNTGQNITALSVRVQIPDAPTGGGITSTLNLYVNGVLRQAINVNSQQTYIYEGTNYNNGTDQDPSHGWPARVWDEYPFFITGAAIAPGSTIMLKKDSANGASFYNIDLIDLETPPAPLSQPANSLSITSYGAVANNPAVNNTPAIQDCINAAQSQGKSVWIPQGTFYMSTSGLGATGITIQGAGIWYSQLYLTGSGGQALGLVSATVKDFGINCNSTQTGCPSAMSMGGSNWLVDRIWVQHTSLAVWAAGDNGTIQNIRSVGTWSDGININNFSGSTTSASNLTITNNFIRNSADDGLALNPTDNPGYTPMNGITVTNNTLANTGGRLVLYGGRNVVIKNNLIRDTVYNAGIGIGYFAQTASLLNIVVEGNHLLRCGGNGFDNMVAAIDAGTDNFSFTNDNGVQQPYQDSGIIVRANLITDPLYAGLKMKSCTNFIFDGNTIVRPTTAGIVIPWGITGNGIFTNNLVTNMGAGKPILLNDASSFVSQISGVNAPRQASSYNSISAGPTLETCGEGGQDLTNITNGTYAVYNNINLDGATMFSARVASANAGGAINIRLDSATGPIIGTCTFGGTGGSQKWTTQTCALSGASGIHNVYLTFTGGSGNLFNLEWLGFLRSSTIVEASSYNSGNSVATEACSEGGQDAYLTSNGAYSVYNNVNLDNVNAFTVRVASPGTGNTITVRMDSPTGTVLGTCELPNTGGYQTWQTATYNLSGANGYHNLYLCYSGSFNTQWFALQGGQNGIEASSYNSGNSVATEACSEGGLDVYLTNNGAYSVYNNVDLNGATSLAVRVASPGTGNTITVRLDSPTGPVIGTCALPNTGGYQTWQTAYYNLSGASGYHNVYFCYSGSFNTKLFAFQRYLNGTEASSYNSGSSVATETCSEGGLDVHFTGSNPNTVYNSVNLTGMTSFSARVASPGTGNTITVRLDSATGTVIGTCTVPNTGGYQSWATATCNLSSASTGYHNVYLTYTGSFNIQWFEFQGGINPIAAGSYTSLSPGTAMFMETCVEGGKDLANTHNGDYAVYNNINLNGKTSFTARAATANVGGNIVIHLDSPTGPVIGTCVVPSTGGWQTWSTQTCALSGASGTHNVYLVFTGGTAGLFNLEWFQFQ